MIEKFIQSQIRDELFLLREGLKRELLKELAPSPWLSRADAARYARVCLATIDGMVRDGRLEKYKIGRSTKFKRSDIDKLFK